MATGKMLGAGKARLALLCILNLYALLSPAPVRGDGTPAPPSMRGYCDAPAVGGFKPNLLLMIDNSASMYDLAYTDTVDPANICLDDSYNNAAQYPGIFDQGTIYSYTFKKVLSIESGNFVVATPQSIPASCSNLRTDFLCVNGSATKISSFQASGKFLNWLSMSKLDLEKKALTGGKFNPSTGLVTAESRGCQGKRFIKMLGAAPITFAVRGPIEGESDFLTRASHGGMTRVDVFANPSYNPYRKAQCKAAVADWQQISPSADHDTLAAGLANLQTAIGNCMGAALYEDAATPPTPSAAKVYTEAMSFCYLYRGKESSIPKDDTGTLLNDCITRNSKRYSGQGIKVPKNGFEDICSSGFYHTIFNLLSSGFLGDCTNTDCSQERLADYCLNIMNPWVADPAAGTNLPGYLLDAGLANLGSVSATLVVRFAPAAAPQGLIQEFANNMNFGAMVFNDNGAGSECGGSITCLKHCQNASDPLPHKECIQSTDCNSPTLVNGKLDTSGLCQEEPRTDGGRIISYLNDPASPLGDHGSGLIASLDAVTANSWTPLSESFYEAIGYFANRTDLRLQAADFDAARPPIKFSCQKNDVLIVTDGSSSADRAQAVLDFVAAGASAWVNGTDLMPPSQTTTSAAAAAPANQGSYNLDDLAWIARNKNIADPRAPIRNISDYLTTYVIYTGPPCGSYDVNGNCTTSDEAVPEKMMQLTAAKGGGRIANAQNPADLETALGSMLQLIGSASNSATDASILATGDANGALYLQEQFYPNKGFDNGATSAAWIGEMQALWYYIDPFIAADPVTGRTGEASAIREDSDGLGKLDLVRDKVARYTPDGSQVQLWQDTDGNGSADVAVGGPIDPYQLKSLWRAGSALWSRDISATPRSIYTPLLPGGTGVSGSGLMKLSWSAPDNSPVLQPFLLASDNAGAVKLLKYLHGFDFPGDAGMRSRTLHIGSIPAASVSSVPTDPYVTNPRDKGIGVWKLGDIVSSTPALQSTVSLGSYDLASPRGYGDASYLSFIGTAAYKNRGTAYVGANDGMLHAFRLGALSFKPGTGESWPASQKAALSGTGLGWEEWAYVPGNALPYLGYLKEPNYSHLFYVDGSVTLADVSLGDPATCARGAYWNCPKDFPAPNHAGGGNWRTVLIGGMGLGGASRLAGDPSCSEGAAGTCVKAPLPTAGLSSYFALDVTSQNKDGTGGTPTLLWEFSPPGLGFATSGAAVVKINARTGADLATHDSTRNGRWFAVFASGPTGSIDCGSCQFQGKSDQNLKLFVVDLNAAAPLTQGASYWVIDTGIPLAFGGSMSGAGIDTDRRNASAPGYYEDDALYLGYTRQAGDGTWTTGGVLRLLTRENPDPGQWVASRVIDGIGPVTGAVSKLQDHGKHNLWLYFGTGRYFFNQDDLTAGRSLFGVKEPCYTSQDALVDDRACSATPLALTDLSDMTDTSAPGSGSKGWWIGLDPAGGDLGSERMTGSPTALGAGGAVFFATFKPSGVPCQQGAGYLWRVKYDTGGSGVALSGKAIVPLSNGSGGEVSLANGLTGRGGRRSQQLTGTPGGVKLITNSGLKPLKKIIHIQER